MNEMRKLQVFRSVGEVYSGVTRHYFDLIFSAPVATILYLAGMGAFMVINASATVQTEALEGLKGAELLNAQWVIWTKFGVWPVLSLLAAGIGALSAAVHWHRFVLLGDRDGALWGRFETRYLWTWVKIILAFAGLMILVAIVASALFYVAFGLNPNQGVSGPIVSVAKILAIIGLVVSYLFTVMWILRVSLALPDAATGGLVGIRTAFAKSSGNGWRLLGYALLVQFGVGLGYALAQIGAAFVLQRVLPQETPGSLFTAEAIAALVCLPVTLYVAMIGVTMLSVAYREIIGLPGEGAAAT